MKVPFLDLKRNYSTVKDEVLREVTEVLDSTQYILGPKVESFEKAFALCHDADYCYGTSSGTDANHLALWALGIGPGDEVIIPVNTFVATAWGITLCGATPVFADCHASSYNLDYEGIESKITSKTKAIIAVHLYGQAADMDSLRAIANRHSLFLVEDAAQAHLAEYKGKRVGTLGDVASFSFYPGKNLGAYGEGGAVMTNDAGIAHKLKLMRDHGSETKYQHVSYGHNYRMESIQGAILSVKLKYLQDWTDRRRAIAKRYCELLGDIKQIKLPEEMPYSRHVFHLFVIQVSERADVQKLLAEAGISTGLHYPIPLHMQACFSHLGHKLGDYPNAEALADNCLSLPIFPEMTDAELVYVCDHLRNCFTNKVIAQNVS